MKNPAVSRLCFTETEVAERNYRVLRGGVTLAAQWAFANDVVELAMAREEARRRVVADVMSVLYGPVVAEVERLLAEAAVERDPLALLNRGLTRMTDELLAPRTEPLREPVLDGGGER